MWSRTRNQGAASAAVYKDLSELDISSEAKRRVILSMRPGREIEEARDLHR